MKVKTNLKEMETVRITRPLNHLTTMSKNRNHSFGTLLKIDKDGTGLVKTRDCEKPQWELLSHLSPATM